MPAINHRLIVVLGRHRRTPKSVNDSGFEPDYCLNKFALFFTAKISIMFDIQKKYQKK